MQWATIDTEGIVTIRDGEPSLTDMQTAVGGDIQALPSMARDGETAVLYVAEDGKRLAMPENETADWLYRFHGVPLAQGDSIVGNVAITGPADGAGEVTGLSESWIGFLRDLPLRIGTSETA